MNNRDTQPQRSGIGRLLFVVITIAFLIAPVSTAFALDKNQIIQMSKLGIEAESIKGAIDKSKDSFKLSKEELGELRVQGVSDEIIEYLKKTGHVEGAKQATSGDAKKDAEKGDETKKEKEGKEVATKKETGAEKGGDGAGAPAPGGGDDEDVSTPAPAPGDQEEEQTFTEEELKKKMAEERKKALEEQKRKKKKRRQLKQAARRLPDGSDALESGDNMEAARIFLRFLSLGPPEGSDNWYEAKFGLAKALYKQGILSGAATPIRQVVMAGADKPHFEEAFRILEELTRKIGYQPPALEELTKVLTKDLPNKFRNDYNYYLGKFFYDYNRNKLAIKYLKKVKSGADDYPESRYLMGVAQLDPSIDNKAGALKNFESAITSGEREEESNEEILQLGYLALARVFYEVGLYNVALFYYQKIPRQSARHAEAMFEKAWTYFQKNDFKRALGTFHTLHSPYYEQWYFPDLYILESTVYLNLCRFDYSKRALAEFQKRYLDKRPRLQKFLEKTKEPKAYWKKITHAYEKGGVAKSGALPEMFVNAVLDDLAFFNIYKVVRLLRKERSALKNNIDALGEFGQKVLDRVDQQLQTKVEEGGILVQQKLTELDQELKKWDLKATQISFDIDSEEKEQLERRLQSRKTKDALKEAGTTLLIVADDWQPWRFEGEYWFDEVSNYRSRQSSRCIEK